MDNPSPDLLIGAFGEVAREALVQREQVPVPGLGLLRVEHEPSRARETADGRRQLLPPRDRVVLASADPS